MDVVTVQKLNEVYFRVTAEPHIEQELSDYFKFEVPSAKFNPRFRNRTWNGYIYLYSLTTKTLYCGLVDHLEQYCAERSLKLVFQDEIIKQEFDNDSAIEFIKLIKPTKIPRDYQLEAFINCVREHRALTLSPTGSGKSLIIYLLTRLYTYNTSKRRALIIVPTIGLVHQMAGDFIDYGCDPDNIYRVTAGVEKHTDCPIIITTWQSIYKQPRQWFDQFKMVIGDECHQYKAKSLTTIMNKLVNCKYRFGFTGTLDNTQVNKLVIAGVFGPIKRVITTKELMDRKQLAALDIKILALKYPDEVKKALKGITYHEEMDFLTQHPERNTFIKNLATTIKGNTLILFQYVEKHGKVLYDEIKTDRKNVHFIHGGVDGEARDDIRALVEDSEDSIIIASYGTFSAGVNIVNLHNVIFASPSKSKIRNLQSIGRGLRTSGNKQTATLYDIADDLTYNNKKNFTLNHLIERVKTYDEEKFLYRIYNIELHQHSTHNQID
jgi:superfamily II DNA or RNA helicase